MSLKEEVYEFIAVKRTTTFVELIRRFPKFFDGKESLLYNNYKNIFLWRGMKREFTQVIKELFDEEKIMVRPISPLVYVYDGKVMALPIAKRRLNYKEPHWLPVIFSSTKLPTEKMFTKYLENDGDR